MSSFGGGGFGGFGSSNNQQNAGFGSSTFGNTNTNTGFGSTSNTGFGSTNATSSNPFGGTGSTFGSGGGFGSSNTSNSLFGNKASPFSSNPTTSSSSLFGNNTATAGTSFGGFGNTNNNTTAGFGNNAPNTSGGVFGQTKPAFGGGSNTGSSLFGGGSGGGFGSTNTNQTGSFGSTNTLGGGPVPPPEGTNVMPFSAVTEKDPGAGATTNHFQSITFMQPYQKYSFEELRLADYNAGRRYGTSTGQAGGFGSSTFGGFGSQSSNSGSFAPTGNNLFGTSNTSTGFGQTSTSGGFGSSNTGSLFGTKPATSGGLFGQQQSSSTSQPSLFGTANTSTGFGGNTGGFAPNTGVNLFGNNQQPQPQQQGQQQQGSSLFGNTGTSNTGFGGFGQQNSSSSGGGLFGSTTATSNPFGGNQQQSGTSSLFGNLNQQNQNQNQSGQKSLFGSVGTNNQQSSGGLFGSTNTNTGGGLFGSNNQPQNTSGGLFGSSNQQNSGGLFGNTANNQQKPSLFGNTNTGTTGGGLFGSNNQQQNTGGLFGNTNNQQQPQQQGSGLFGNTGNTGGSLFGNLGQNKPPTGSSLFGNSQQNQQQQGSTLFGGNSLLGNSQQNQQTPQQQPQALYASLLEGNPYGTASIWSGLPTPTPQNSGPLATPLSASQRQKQRAAMPRAPLNLAATSRLSTPPQRTGTYGFSYSTYGTPSSTSSTPGGLRGSLLGSGFTGGSFGRSVNKSFSAHNLRSRFDTDRESILSPGAFSAGSSRYSNGSIKRLTIDRSIKHDLFGRPALPPASTPNGEETSQQPSKLKKRVSFEGDGINGQNGTLNGTLNGTTGALVPTETDESEPTPEELGFLRSRRNHETNGVGSSSSSDTVRSPEMEQVRGKELAIVPEDREPEVVTAKSTSVTKAQTSGPSPPPHDPRPGEYWMRPSKAQLSSMSREELSHVEGFTVGRKGCGQVTFDKPVDLTSIPIDNVCGKIVKIEMRTLTVYDDPATKPPQGKGLNMPSTIQLENSWPRKKGSPVNLADTKGPVFEKHVKRLKSLPGVNFVDYDTMTGVWTFRVPHFTTYGLDYDDDETELDQSTLSAPPDTSLAAPGSSYESPMSVDDSEHEESSPEDDTFGYKKILPGAFGRQAAYEEDEEYDAEDGISDEYEQEGGSFLGDGSAGSASDQEMDGHVQDRGSDQSYQSEEDLSGDEGMDMAGSFPAPERTVEQQFSPIKPILNASVRLGTPGKALIDVEGDWADELRRTISPRKQDRQMLREMQAKALLNREDDSTPTAKSAATGKEITNSIDLMQSLFGKQEERRRNAGKKQNAAGKGFEWPYAKRPKTFAGEESNMSDVDREFHRCFKPRWTPTGSLISAPAALTSSMTSEDWGWNSTRLVSSERRDVVLFDLVADPKAHAAVSASIDQADVLKVDGVPFARTKKLEFEKFAAQSPDFPEMSLSEQNVWALARILFDDFEDRISMGVPEIQRPDFAQRIKKDRLTEFWKELISVTPNLTDLWKDEEADYTDQAIAFISANRIPGAVVSLQEDGNYHLATLVAQLNKADQTFRGEVKLQIKSWKKLNLLSEMPDNVRAVYEILAGNTTVPTYKETGPLEDRASKFHISERFNMNWMQAFGLSLWYAIHEDDSIEAAVADFQAKLDSGEEVTFPYFGNPHNASDTEGRSGEDPLWVLLKLYASMKRSQHTKGSKGLTKSAPILPEALLPVSAGCSPFNHRFIFQLFHALAARIPTLQVDSTRADQLASDFAFQLSSTGDLIGAAFALLHLTEPFTREKFIKDLLTRHADVLPEPPIGQNQINEHWSTLTDCLKIPSSWIFEAKALYAKALGNNLKEVSFLLQASKWDAAHESFCRTVAPRVILDRDYDLLRKTIEPFLRANKPEETFFNWDIGGAVYADFLSLVQHGKHGIVKGSKEYKFKLKQLHSALVTLGSNLKGDRVSGLEERVAIKEMSRLVADWAADEKEVVSASSILELPLTEDARLAHTLEMGTNYYRAVMAAAR